MSTMVGRDPPGTAACWPVLLYLTIPVVVVVAISFSSGNFLVVSAAGPVAALVSDHRQRSGMGQRACG